MKKHSIKYYFHSETDFMPSKRVYRICSKNFVNITQRCLCGIILKPLNSPENFEKVRVYAFPAQWFCAVSKKVPIAIPTRKRVAWCQFGYRIYSQNLVDNSATMSTRHQFGTVQNRVKVYIFSAQKLSRTIALWGLRYESKRMNYRLPSSCEDLLESWVCFLFKFLCCIFERFKGDFSIFISKKTWGYR